MGIMGKPSPERIEASKRYYAKIARAREIDPEAFALTSVPLAHFMPELQGRQMRAMEQAEIEMSKGEG